MATGKQHESKYCVDVGQACWNEGLGKLQIECPKTVNWLSLIKNGIQYTEFMLV
jgi:hypothetical protein